MAGLRLLQPPLRLLLILGQLLERVPRGVHAGVGGEERDEDELVAELAQLLEGEGVAVARPLEGRGVVEREGQVGVRLAHGLRELDGGLARGVRQLRPHGIDAGVGVQPAPGDRLLQAAAHRAVGVGARDDEEVGVEAVAHVDGGAVLAQRLLAAHAHLAGDVATALREALVLEVDAGHAGLDHLLHRAHGREGVAVAVVGVGDDRDVDGARHHRGDARDLGLGQESHVRPPVGHGHGISAEVDRLDAHLLGDLRVQRRVHATREHVGLVLQQPAEGLAFALDHRVGLLGSGYAVRSSAVVLAHQRQ